MEDSLKIFSIYFYLLHGYIENSLDNKIIIIHFIIVIFDNIFARRPNSRLSWRSVHSPGLGLSAGGLFGVQLSKAEGIGG